MSILSAKRCVRYATAPGMKSLLLQSFASFGIDLAEKLVSICVDGCCCQFVSS